MFVFVPAAAADPCDPNPCANSGTCALNALVASGYECSCANGYDGDNCDNGKIANIIESFRV